jgi:hypothetical protein
MESGSATKLKSALVGMPVLALAALGLAVCVQVGCSTPEELGDNGLGEDGQCLSGYGYGYYIGNGVPLGAGAADTASPAADTAHDQAKGTGGCP